MAKHQGRLVYLRHHIGNGKGFAGAGYAQERLGGIAFGKALYQFFDGLGLVAGRLISRDKLEHKNREMYL